MKEIMAFIRMDNMNETIHALSEAGYGSMTAHKVFGRGKKQANYEYIEAVVEQGMDAPVRTVESISENHRLIAKRSVTVVAEDDQVDEIIKIIVEKNQTGNMGDGKIFVLPLTEVYRVRTGETGSNAI